jgi:hypothetical protein
MAIACLVASIGFLLTELCSASSILGIDMLDKRQTATVSQLNTTLNYGNLVRLPITSSSKRRSAIYAMNYGTSHLRYYDINDA